MNKTLQENNYVVIDNFITELQAKELYEVFKRDINSQSISAIHDSQCPNSYSKYNYRFFVELLINKIAPLSELMEESVLPTYTYARLYKHGETLKSHTDRPACEISITAHLGSDGVPWPIYFTKPNGEIVSVELKPGQAAIYLGMVSTHWRDTYTGNEYGQVFLHYVRSRGEHWDEFFDIKRIKEET
jgi:hypothetical protein